MNNNVQSMVCMQLAADIGHASDTNILMHQPIGLNISGLVGGRLRCLEDPGGWVGGGAR